MMSRIAVPLCAIAALIKGTTCLPSPLNERATKEQPRARATAHGSIGWNVLTAPFFCTEPRSAVDDVRPGCGVDEVGRGLRRAPDARHLGEQMGFDPQLVERLDHVVRDRVVTAARAQRRGGTLVGVSCESGAVQGCAHAGTASSCISGSVIATAGMGWPL